MGTELLDVRKDWGLLVPHVCHNHSIYRHIGAGPDEKTFYITGCSV